MLLAATEVHKIQHLHETRPKVPYIYCSTISSMSDMRTYGNNCGKNCEEIQEISRDY